MKRWFNNLPSVIKVTIYSGITAFLGVLLLDLQGESGFDIKEYITVPVNVAINVVLYLIAQERN